MTPTALRAVFAHREPTHVEHLTSVTAESFGGPAHFTPTLGFAYLIAVHRGLKITEEQRVRFVDLYLRALDVAGLLPSRPPVYDTVAVSERRLVTLPHGRSESARRSAPDQSVRGLSAALLRTRRALPEQPAVAV
jgi:hypothetical protein